MAEDHSTTGTGKEQKKEEVKGKKKKKWSRRWVRSCFVFFVKSSSWNHQAVVRDDVEPRRQKKTLQQD